MGVYLYNTDLLCERCGKEAKEIANEEISDGLRPELDGLDLTDESQFDSAEYPKYSNDTTSDHPDFCADCGEFLENPLTEEGEQQLIRMAIEKGYGSYEDEPFDLYIAEYSHLPLTMFIKHGELKSKLEIHPNDETLPMFTSLGAYPMVYLNDYGDTLCAKCGAKTSNHQPAMEFFVHYEGLPEICTDCNTEISSAYGNPSNIE